MCSNTCASTWITTRASTCITTRASTCHYTRARLLFKNMPPGAIHMLLFVRMEANTGEEIFFSYIAKSWSPPKRIWKVVWHIGKIRLGGGFPNQRLQKAVSVQEIQSRCSVFDKLQIGPLYLLLGGNLKEDHCWIRAADISIVFLGGWIWGHAWFRVENCQCHQLKKNFRILNF